MPMNLPNLLTLSRIVAIPLVILTFFLPPPFGPWAGCVLFAAAGVTDWLDGQFARRWHQQSSWGRVLDPIADKLLVATILFMLAALERITPVTIFPALVILAREILVSGLREHLAMLQRAGAGIAARQVEDRRSRWWRSACCWSATPARRPADAHRRRAAAVDRGGADPRHRLRLSARRHVAYQRRRTRRRSPRPKAFSDHAAYRGRASVSPAGAAAARPR